MGTDSDSDADPDVDPGGCFGSPRFAGHANATPFRRGRLLLRGLRGSQHALGRGRLGQESSANTSDLAPCCVSLLWLGVLAGPGSVGAFMVPGVFPAGAGKLRSS